MGSEGKETAAPALLETAGYAEKDQPVEPIQPAEKGGEQMKIIWCYLAKQQACQI